MCGINVVITKLEASDHIEYITKANSLLEHRGPDNSAYKIYNKNNTILAHTRLSIIDLNAEANQPLLSQDENYSIVFNGEIYNYLELKNECLKLGSSFKTNSDTEVILESYRHWGNEAFKRFTGMWALAILDITNNKLIISRDPFGIKPLYYTIDDNSLYLSSEITPLKSSHKDAKTLDKTTIKLFQEQGILERGCWTFYKNIKKFPHSHYSVIDIDNFFSNRKIVPKLYWNIEDYKQNYENINIIEEFKARLESNTKLHTRADVEIASTLSGGLDSSVISYLAREKVSKTFTSCFPKNKALDETYKAEHISKLINAKHFFAYPNIDSLKKDFNRLLYYQEEPFGTLSIYIQYKVFEAIKEEGLKVSLDGQGADEVLGGYKFIINYFLNSYFSNSKVQFLSEAIMTSLNNMKDNNFKFDRNIIKNLSSKSKLNKLQDIITTETDGSYEERMDFLKKPINSHRDILLYLTFEGNLQQLLKYVDRNSMAFSIESRVPFLTHDFVMFAVNLPTKFLYKKGRTKFLLREIYKEILHKDTYNEKIKLGFPAPDTEWFQELSHCNSDHKNFREFITSKWIDAQGSDNEH